MCLGVPGQIVEVKAKQAIVDFWGVRKCVRLDQLDERALPGDYIIDHGGYAVRVIPPQDVADTVALYEVLLSEAGEDPLVRNVVDELDSLAIDLEEPALM
ncbi:MAG TPA: HypC/HybG/HupF family hydrogenase formation chaperone [Thermoanaerobaculia bacterium]|nr:HypC/HybG/HupF family hydrogenase formation chaperone [Thermoanaerobaculia bacterium]